MPRIPWLMELILAYGAGLLTLINPCVLPVLPIVLATALQSGRQGTQQVAAGMILSYEVQGMAVTVNGRAGRDDTDRPGNAGQLLGGMLWGAGWSPCIGPTLGGAISLASQGESLGRAGAIMVAFALGVSTIIVALGYGARSAIQKRQAAMRVIAAKSRPIMGVVFVAVGTAILFKVHHMIEIWAIQTLPPWLSDLSVSL